MLFAAAVASSAACWTCSSRLPCASAAASLISASATSFRLPQRLPLPPRLLRRVLPPPQSPRHILLLPQLPLLPHCFTLGHANDTAPTEERYLNCTPLRNWPPTTACPIPWVCLPACLPTVLACLPACLPIYLSVCLPLCLSASIYLFVCLPVWLSVFLPASVCLPACLPTDAHDLIAILSCGGGSWCPIRAWEAVLELSCHCPFAVHTSTRQVMSVRCLPPASGSVLRGLVHTPAGPRQLTTGY